MIKLFYRASHVLEYLGWVDLDLESSPGWWAATVATYWVTAQAGWWNIPNPSQQNPVYEDMGRPVFLVILLDSTVLVG